MTGGSWPKSPKRRQEHPPKTSWEWCGNAWLELGESLSLQVFELSSGGQTEDRVEGAAINVEGSHTSCSCNHDLMLQEKSETVD